jgi:hypothetical protein
MADEDLIRLGAGRALPEVARRDPDCRLPR